MTEREMEMQDYLDRCKREGREPVKIGPTLCASGAQSRDWSRDSYWLSLCETFVPQLEQGE